MNIYVKCTLHLCLLTVCLLVIPRSSSYAGLHPKKHDLEAKRKNKIQEVFYVGIVSDNYVWEAKKVLKKHHILAYTEGLEDQMFMVFRKDQVKQAQALISKDALKHHYVFKSYP